jgi:uncharacterized protein (UPF0332 family)
VSAEAEALWERAVEAKQSAAVLIDVSPDRAAATAYYAAFFAVSALFTLQGRSFRKHSAVEAAVHRDLVKPGLWPVELGANYSELQALRHTGDYGVLERVSTEDARAALDMAGHILDADRRARPDLQEAQGD